MAKKKFSRVKSKYRGLQAERYSREPLEERFALHFQEVNELSRDTFMSDLCGTPFSDDRKIAATVIQWLGSECGQYFLAQVLAGADRATMNPALRDMLEDDDVTHGGDFVLREKGKRFDVLLTDLKQIADIAKVAIRREDAF